MDWTATRDVELIGLDQAEFDSVWPYVTIYQPDPSLMADGDIYWELLALTFDVGTNNWWIQLVDEDAKPVVNRFVCTGWECNPDEPCVTMDMYGQPREGMPPESGRLPKTDLLGDWRDYTNVEGKLWRSWGPGERHDPKKVKGAHFPWVPTTEAGDWTDLIDGMGWRAGTSYGKLCPTFAKRIIGGTPPPPPPPGDCTEYLVRIESKLDALVASLAAGYHGLGSKLED